jgi:hypothetical protein
MLKFFGETARFMLWYGIWQNNNMLLLPTIQISRCSYYRYSLHWSALLYIKSHFPLYVCTRYMREIYFCQRPTEALVPISLLPVANSITITTNVLCWEHDEGVWTYLRLLYTHNSRKFAWKLCIVWFLVQKDESKVTLCFWYIRKCQLQMV